MSEHAPKARASGAERRRSERACAAGTCERAPVDAERAASSACAHTKHIHSLVAFPCHDRTIRRMYSWTLQRSRERGERRSNGQRAKRAGRAVCSAELKGRATAGISGIGDSSWMRASYGMWRRAMRRLDCLCVVPGVARLAGRVGQASRSVEVEGGTTSEAWLRPRAKTQIPAATARPGIARRTAALHGLLRAPGSALPTTSLFGSC